VQIDKNPTITEWLNLEQLRKLVQSGELVVTSRSGTLRLYVNFADRAAAAGLVK
jgi:hypothetical protein